MPLLSVSNLSINFRTRSGTVHALENVSLSANTGEIVGIVGESGSGKTVTAYAILRILESAAEVTSGQILFEGKNLLDLRERALREIRGRDIAMIFQNPRGALNPIRTVGRQIADVIERHGRNDQQIWNRVIAALSTVRIPAPSTRANSYAHELSGGMCQRVGIAIGMSCKPKLILADEPTTGLDVTTQATVMDLTRDLVREGQMAMILITHDLRLAVEYCDRIVVMHAGHVVETANAKDIFDNPRHPYTAALIAATPGGASNLDALRPIEGSIPDLRRDLPPCRFIERCDRRIARCATDPLETVLLERQHSVACWRPL